MEECSLGVGCDGRGGYTEKLFGGEPPFTPASCIPTPTGGKEKGSVKEANPAASQRSSSL